MNSIKFLIFTCFIYQSFAGSPGYSSSSSSVPASSSDCVTCRSVFKDGQTLSDVNCNPGSATKVLTTISFLTNGSASGACKDPNVGIYGYEVSTEIDSYTTSVTLQFLVDEWFFFVE